MLLQGANTHDLNSTILTKCLNSGKNRNSSNHMNVDTPVHHNQNLFDKLIQEDDLSWKTMIMESVKNNEMDPWDIDISFIASEFLIRLAQLRDMNFKITGKIVLASALLLKLKSRKFVDQDISLLDQLIASTEVQEDSIIEETPDITHQINSLSDIDEQNVHLVARTPQPRKRKVSVYDLIEALEQALEVNSRRGIKRLQSAPQVHIPIKKFDINSSMDDLLDVVTTMHQENKCAPKFSQLAPSADKLDVVFTFIPLLHLRNAQKIDLIQNQAFEDFSVELIPK